MSDSDEEVTLRDQIDVTIDFSGGTPTMEIVDTFGETHTEESRFLNSLLEEATVRARFADIVSDRFVPLDKAENLDTVSAAIRSNQEERYYKVTEALESHPAFILVRGSRHANEIWAETPLANGPVGLDEIERKFGLEEYNTSVRYNDEWDCLVRHITWDVKRFVIDIGDPDYDQFIQEEIPDKLPDYVDIIDELRGRDHGMDQESDTPDTDESDKIRSKLAAMNKGGSTAGK